MEGLVRTVFYDYAYFVVIDAKGRLCIYWQHGFYEVVGLTEYEPPTIAPSGAWVIKYNKITDTEIS
jgi:hypothetical protein